jgi:hypothetical protein
MVRIISWRGLREPSNRRALQPAGMILRTQSTASSREVAAAQSWRASSSVVTLINCTRSGSNVASCQKICLGAQAYTFCLRGPYRSPTEQVLSSKLSPSPRTTSNICNAMAWAKRMSRRRLHCCRLTLPLRQKELRKLRLLDQHYPRRAGDQSSTQAARRSAYTSLTTPKLPCCKFKTTGKTPAALLKNRRKCPVPRSKIFHLSERQKL